eukprot:TRINITY_DN4343_c0_g1_i2.p1 TRINITY_DN4343_c0_g1~~TRINITY_DN4343_c0_g1_i2.p1  ORF type:complete len:364 (-),score=96.58 TRINITY_DN4343_c0_g1_i2:910-2001(-)
MAQEAFFAKRFQGYYNQLNQGCGRPDCQNPHCQTNWKKQENWNDELKLSEQAQTLASDLSIPHFCEEKSEIKLHIRGPTGGRTTLSLSPNATLSQLLNLTSQAFSVPVGLQKFLHGYPPTPINGFLEMTLKEVQIQQPSDTLIVERLPPSSPPFYSSVSSTAPNPNSAAALSSLSPSPSPSPAPSATPPSSGPSSSSPSPSTQSSVSTKPTPTPTTAHKPTAPPSAKPSAPVSAPKPTPTSSSSTVFVTAGRSSTYSGFKLVRRIVPADNSCLFTSVGYVLMRGRENGRHGLRSLIGKHILQNPTEYTEAFLSMPPENYVKWIESNENWGGAIECSILAAHFQTEIAVFDIEVNLHERRSQKD